LGGTQVSGTKRDGVAKGENSASDAGEGNKRGGTGWGHHRGPEATKIVGGLQHCKKASISVTWWSDMGGWGQDHRTNAYGKTARLTIGEWMLLADQRPGDKRVRVNERFRSGRKRAPLVGRVCTESKKEVPTESNPGSV